MYSFVLLHSYHTILLLLTIHVYEYTYIIKLINVTNEMLMVKKYIYIYINFAKINLKTIIFGCFTFLCFHYECRYCETAKKTPILSYFYL